MIPSIRALGAYALGQRDDDEIRQLVENPNAGGNYANTLEIHLQSVSEGYRVQEFRLTETDEVHYDKYLYRRWSSNGPNYSPTALQTDWEKTIPNKVIGWFKKADDVLKKNGELLDEQEKEQYQRIAQCLREHASSLVEQAKQETASVKGSSAVTLVVDGAYLLEIPLFQKLFLALLEGKKEGASVSNQVCSVCFTHKPEVIGNLSVFKFYTLDKPGYIAGGFNEKTAWRNYPVCLSCQRELEEGKKFLEQNLQFSFYGMHYLLIPKFVLPDSEQKGLMEEIVEVLEETRKQVRLNEKQQRQLTSDEQEILAALAEWDDVLLLDFLFIQKLQSGSVERILLHIEDVYPSRLRKIFSAKEKVEYIFFPEGQSTYQLGRLRRFLQKSQRDKRNTDLDNYFLDVCHRIFTGRPLAPSFLFPFYMRQIRDALQGVDEASFIYTVLDALMNEIFFQILGNYPRREGILVTERFAPLFEKYGNQADTPEKQGLFLLGALVQHLLDYQKRERKAQPFYEQLHGLKLTQREVKGMLPKVRRKYQEYDLFTLPVSRLYEATAECLMRSEGRWPMTVDEINFFIAAGMALKYQVMQLAFDPKEQDNADGTAMPEAEEHSA